MVSNPVNVVVVGLGFGADFIPIYSRHPNVARVALCDPARDKLERMADDYAIADRFTSLEEALDDDAFDAYHLVTPVRLHARQAVQVLDSGRHCASAVPMGLSLGEIDSVIQAAARSGKNYMMMETAAYHRAFLLAQELYRSGELGELTFLRGAHLRDRSEMPDYWRGFPPLKYATHVVSPLLAILGTRATAVHAFGSGILHEENRGEYDNPFPVETAILSLENTSVKAEVSQACFQFARPAQEGFSFFGDRMSMEWPQIESHDVLLHTMHDAAEGRHSRFRKVESEWVSPPDRPGTLPEEISEFLRATEYDPGSGRAPIQVPSHHGGSHPRLVHEFISSIVEERRPRIDEYTAADWCAPGICAHESALNDGARVEIPDFRALHRA